MTRTAVYRPEDVAAILDCSVRHVHTLVRRGTLPATLTDPLRIPRAAVEALLTVASAMQPAAALPARRSRLKPIPTSGRLTLADLRAQVDAQRPKRAAR